MATLITQPILQTGFQPAYQAASAGGDQYTPSSVTFIAVKNGGGAVTLSVVTTASLYGQPIGNIAIPIPGGSEVFCGPYDPGEVQQSGSSLANLTYSGVSNLSVAAISCPPS